MSAILPDLLANSETSCHRRDEQAERDKREEVRGPRQQRSERIDIDVERGVPSCGHPHHDDGQGEDSEKRSEREPY
jgi:hypothetical protein